MLFVAENPLMEENSRRTDSSGFEGSAMEEENGLTVTKIRPNDLYGRLVSVFSGKLKMTDPIETITAISGAIIVLFY